MRKLILLLFLAPLSSFSMGCGGSPEEADTSHLESKEADEARAAAAGRYENVGRKGPDAKTGKTK